MAPATRQRDVISWQLGGYIFEIASFPRKDEILTKRHYNCNPNEKGIVDGVIAMIQAPISVL